MTAWRTATAAVATALLLALGACSSGSTDGKDAGRTTTTTTTVAPEAQEQWVAKWRGTVAQQYGPEQQAFLAAVQGGKVAEVQAAAVKLLAANEALLDAIRVAGAPPDAAESAADRLQTALLAEHKIVEEIQRVCTGSNDECQAAVTLYGDNNSKEIVPALVALKI